MKPEFIILFLSFHTVLSQYDEIQGNNFTNLQFRCTNGQCIAKNKLCNGANDCVDSSDELNANCTDIRCPYYAFQCTYGGCVDRNAVCNGVQDCVDNSDELLTKCGNRTAPSGKLLCKYNEFSCHSGQCVDGLSVCDGDDDCYDGTDETLAQCVNFRCPPYGFRCDYGGCIDQKHICDGVEDCKDASDENKDLCNKESQKPKRPPKLPTPSNLPSNDPSGSCLLPPYPNGGRYELYRTKKNYEMFPGNLVSNRTILKYFCKDGYVLSGEKFSSCERGKWDPGLQDCKKMCPGLESTSVDMRCEFKGETCPCDKRVAPGTKMFPDCKPSYNLPNADIVFRQTECLEDGQWAHNLFNCVPECGIRVNKTAQPLVINGTTVVGEYPWHVALYHKNKYICGGSIITPKAVLTAAHCVYHDKTRRMFNPKDIIVAVGKYNSLLEIKNRHEVRFGLDAIYIEDTYQGSRNRYASDIAILELNSIIKINAFVMPICIDEFDKYKLYMNPEDLGFVVGWGGTEKSVTSDKLLVSQLKYHSFASCHKSDDSNFKMFVTTDKFCAALPKVNQLDNGDSGGALSFMRKDGVREMHFIYGIVSVKDNLNPDYAIFTNITYHLDWINKKKILIKNKLIRKKSTILF